MNTLEFTNQLFETKPFDFSKHNKNIFLESFKEIASHHYHNNIIFKGFWDACGLNPGDIKSEEDLQLAPPIMVNIFKEWELCSVPRENIVLRLTSSGTGGQKSQMLLNQGSLDRVKKLAYNIHHDLNMTSPQPTNYLCFTYDPKVANDLGTAFTDELLTHFTSINSVYYALQWDSKINDFTLNTKGVIQTLEHYQQQSKPVRFLGFPAFIYKALKDYNLKFNFGASSWVQTGGGWKTLADEEIPKNDFRSFVSERLGIPKENVRDLFGMVEHGIPYVDCNLGNLHIPQYSRIYIRSPKDLSILPNGEVGLIQFICTYNDSYPSMNLLTTDWGKIGKCDCGLDGSILEIVGRAGITKSKGCAISAIENVT